MANDVTGNPWILDTPSTNLVWTGNIKVSHIEFFDYAADGDNATLTDAAGRFIARLNGNAALETERTGNISWVYNGLKLTVLTAGKVAVYLKDK